VLVILVTLACQIPTGLSTPDSNTVNTQIALALTQTALSSVQLLPSATTGVLNQDQNLINTQVAMALTQTALFNLQASPTATNTPPQPASPNTLGLPTATDTQAPPTATDTQAPPTATNTQAPPTATNTQAPPTATNTQAPPTATNTQAPPTATSTQEQQDIDALIDSSNILIYEDVAEDFTFIPYVKRALASVGGHHQYVGDAMGTFMNKLDSGTQWDLIIVAAELRTAISGDYWTVIKDKVDDGAALVSEIWYLDSINDGKIAPLMRECGVKLQRDWQAKATYNRLDYGMYWADPSSPVFNTPNRVERFGASLTVPAWKFGDIGDLLEVTDGSKAQILASLTQGQDSAYGLLSSCMDGQVLFQTFSSHNYPTNDMIALWENYIIFTLTNHFQATP